MLPGDFLSGRFYQSDIVALFRCGAGQACLPQRLLELDRQVGLRLNDLDARPQAYSTALINSRTLPGQS